MPQLTELPLGIGKVFTHYGLVKATDHIIPNSKLQVEGTITHESVKDEPTIENYLKEKFELKTIAMGVTHSSMKAPITGAYLEGAKVMALTLSYQGYTHYLGSAHLFNHLHAFSKSIVRLLERNDYFETHSDPIRPFRTIDNLIKDIKEPSPTIQGQTKFFNHYQEGTNLKNDHITEESNLVQFFHPNGAMTIVGLWEQAPDWEDHINQFSQLKTIPVTIESLSHGYWDEENLIAALKVDEHGRTIFLTKVGCERLEGKVVARFARSESAGIGWDTIEVLKIKEAG